MEDDVRKNEYQEYIDRVAKIRKLSSPVIKDMDDADSYSERLRENFVQIGELAEENRKFLDAAFFPYIKSEEMLDDKIVDVLMTFGDELISADTAESLDLPIMSMLADRLFHQADEKKDLESEIIQMDSQMTVLYELMNMTARITAYPEISEHYRKLGIEVAKKYMELLKPERFLEIESMELRELVMTDARYGIVFFEGYVNNQEKNQEQLRSLKYMLEIENDPFYREALPEYNWTYHRYRVLQYYALASEKNNSAGFTQEELKLIYERTRDMIECWDKDDEGFLSIITDFEERDYLVALEVRNGYLCGRYDRETTIEKLLEIYKRRNVKNYTAGGGYVNIGLPEDIFFIVSSRGCSVRDQYIVHSLYKDLLSYAFHLPNGESLSAFLEYYAHFVHDFIEIPSGISFEDMVIQCIAAFHPPTYVHSVMVGQITECLVKHIISHEPRLLTGVLGTKTAAEVVEKKDDILMFAYHSALCHDFGKIMIIDTILVYGRKLLDMEFDLIKTHPKMGYELMKMHSSTAKYAEVALGHHKWYDNSRGYPEDFDTGESELKPLIDVVMCADCLDAATDTVGRSYNRGKKLEDYIKELEEGAGTHYAPWLPGILKSPDVYDDLQYLLTEGRQQNYRNTYFLLCNLKKE